MNQTLISHFDELNKKENKKNENDKNIFSVNNIAKTLKPTIKKIIDALNNSKSKANRGRLNNSRRSNESSFLKEKYINELINEFEEDKSRSLSRGSSRSINKNKSITNQFNKAETLILDPSNKNIFGFNSHVDPLSPMNQMSLLVNQQNLNKTVSHNLQDYGTKKINSENKEPINTLATQAANKIAELNSIPNANGDKPKRTLKDMFAKAFNFTINNKKDVSQSKLAKLLQESDETSKPNPSPISNPNLNNKNINEIPKPNSEKKTNSNSNNKNINEIMSKIDNNKLNSSEISIKNAKLNNSSFIDLNDDNENENANKYDFKEGVKKEMKNIFFNVIKDETDDAYEFKTYYIKAENIIKKSENIETNKNHKINGANNSVGNNDQNTKNISKIKDLSKILF